MGGEIVNTVVRILSGEHYNKFASLVDNSLLIYLGIEVVEVPKDSVTYEVICS